MEGNKYKAACAPTAERLKEQKSRLLFCSHSIYKHSVWAHNGSFWILVLIDINVFQMNRSISYNVIQIGTYRLISYQLQVAVKGFLEEATNPFGTRLTGAYLSKSK